MPPVQLFSALADETRCAIIQMLRVEPLPVHRLAMAFAISRPAISRHLRVLNEAGLVAERKQGRENIYALHVEPLHEGTAWLNQLSPYMSPAQPAPAKPVKTKPIKAEPTDGPRIGQMEFDL